MCHGEGLDGKIDVKRQSMFLEKYKPYNIFHQEVDMYTRRAYYKNQIYTFSKYARLPYRSMGTSIKYNEGFYGDGILSRFPIEYSANFLSPLIYTDSEQRSHLCAKVVVGTTKLNLFSVHLSTYHEERILSCQELISITDNIPKDEKIIIGGDFNVGITKEGKHLYSYDKQDSYEEYSLLEQNFNRVQNTKNTWFAGDRKRMPRHILLFQKPRTIQFQNNRNRPIRPLPRLRRIYHLKSIAIYVNMCYN